MKYEVRFDSKEIENLESQEKYLVAINLIISEVKYNYDIIKSKVGNIGELSEIYTSISYLGNDNGLMPETEKRILKLVKLNREKFKKIYELLN